MRILVVLPMYGGSLPVGRYCAVALTELGHLVETFEAPEFYQSFQALKALRVTAERLEYLQNSFLQVTSQAVLAKAETFGPDLVLSMAQAPLNRAALKRLRRDGVATAMWFVEDCRLFTYWRAFASYYDFFAVIQKESFLEQLKAMGGCQAFYLPLAMHPSIHRPLELDAVEKRRFGSDLSFLGAGYPNRRLAFRQLLSYNFKIWGTEWEDEPLLAPCLQRQGERIPTDDAVRIFNASKINLNLHSSIHTDKLVSGGDFVNPRTFELAGCRAFQLADRRSLLPDLFGENELAVFENMEDLREKIDYYLGDEAARQEMAERSWQRALAEHTYVRRMRTLLDFISASRPDWPKKRVSSAFAALGEAAASQMEQLLLRLQLPPDASFDDLVTALRSQQGKLSPSETAILFLDEWRKQYKR